MTHPWFAPRAPRVLAHRGFVPPDAEDIAENSFAAVAAAHAAGAAYVESDCHLTADGEVVLFHDEDLSRVTGDPRAVAAVTHRELDRLMTSRGGLITLRQALETFPDVRFNLDVKADAAALPVGRIVASHADRVLLTSFSDTRRRAALEAADRFAHGTRPATSAGTATMRRVVAAVAARSPWAVRRALEGVDALQVPERHRGVRIVSPRLIDAAHRAGTEVHVWTVNNPDDMTRLLDMGVDGIVTDRADLALRVTAPRRR
ncbi:glycerophosphodiester phosphodiesterase [Microbacterium sp. zg.Y1090]|uniref:glycerophosphodiester phosphodiesterase family protein n=1 Tax=Microbacterium TaxID=33882 RepID=UPI00214B85C2|nr:MULTISPECIES: glycerophosphodiester phosphodiesterase family protein [unclassified Microbacterium]MCR2811954.1 glycerophosphodiester phosphodiesterase [Microbacterium sp. zg.Y1084]MCR2818607.1 glycerophosphodiester phosphodiesterase [Microbacterium sp. zg.Y1090]MDL5486421.1 glycerophosphodiester phosphodiesterase family protein [Microbacterium sp. zg-Y1211]WIM29607.1 glycerophosphodiester phosphodiesterase family protein [Microbacterium sp. zg-Y1090]